MNPSSAASWYLIPRQFMHSRISSSRSGTRKYKTKCLGSMLQQQKQSKFPRMVMVIVRSFIYTSLLCVANFAEATEGLHDLQIPRSSHQHVARHLEKPREFGQPPTVARHASESSAWQASSSSGMSTLGSKAIATPSAALLSSSGVQSMNSITSTTIVPASNPTQASNSSTLQDIATIHSRRLETIIGSITSNSSNISTWITDLQGDGKWLGSDIDYTAGCDGRKANWPAAEHWVRISQLPDTQLDIIHPQCTHASPQVRWLLLGMGASKATTNTSIVRRYSLP